MDADKGIHSLLLTPVSVVADWEAPYYFAIDLVKLILDDN